MAVQNSALPIMALQQTSAQRALAIAELLDNLFAYLDRHDAAHAAQVSRGWIETGRDHVWHTVNTPCQLLGLLAPMQHICPERFYDPRHVRQPFPLFTTTY